MDRSPLAAHPDGVLVRVWVVPRASRSEIKGLHDGRIKVRVMAPPEAGRANDEVIRLLADLLGVRVEMVSGAGSREKLVMARGIGLEAAAEKLSI
ncbi:MAG: DUF167 domain-containing protein [Acidimicrobiia bacterium]